MGRNYFSRHGGPYFINDGVSQHDHHHDNSEDKELSNLIYGLLGIVCVLLPVSMAIVIAAVL
jgi:hypothetical protein